MSAEVRQPCEVCWPRSPAPALFPSFDMVLHMQRRFAQDVAQDKTASGRRRSGACNYCITCWLPAWSRTGWCTNRP